MKKFLKTIITCLALLLMSNTASAQFEEFENNPDTTQNHKKQKEGQLIDRMVFGGSFGLGFDSYTFYGEVLPQVGYVFNPYLQAGVVATYMYTGYEDYYANTISQSVFGGGLYTDVIPFQFLVLHLEAQAVNFKEIFKTNTPYNPDADRIWDVPILAGAGYRMAFGEKSSVNYMLLFNINNTKPLQNNVYPGGVLIRITFLF